MRLELRWDAADLSRVLIFRPDRTRLCWATRQRVMNVDSPKDLAESKQQKKERRLHRRVMQQAATAVAGLSAEDQQRYVEQMKEARRNAEAEKLRDTIPFPGQRKQAQPRSAEQPGDELEELLQTVRERSEPEKAEEAEEKLELYGIPI
jgi:hypothetical protein